MLEQLEVLERGRIEYNVDRLLGQILNLDKREEQTKN